MPDDAINGLKLYRVKFSALNQEVQGIAEAKLVNGDKIITIKGNLELDLGKGKLCLGAIEVEVNVVPIATGGDTSTVIIGVN